VGDRLQEPPPTPATPEAAFLLGSRTRHDLKPPAARIGRDPGGEVVVEHASVAAHHADLRYDGGSRGWALSAAGSGSVILVNGEPLAGTRRLVDRDVLTVGRATLTFGQPPREVRPAGEVAAARTGAVRRPGWLLATRGPLAGQVFPLASDSTLGRGDAATLRIDDLLLSAVHVRFEAQRDGGLSVKDLGSTNGSLLNGERLLPDAPRALRGGDRVAVGRHEFRFATTPPEGQTFDASSQSRDRVAAPTRAMGRSSWRLEQAQEGGPPALFPLADDLVRVGRAPHSDLHLPHRDVSREHAELRATDRGYEVRDLESKLGTTVNGKGLAASAVRLLDDGDEVSFAGHPFRVRKVPRVPEDEEAATALRLRAALVPLIPRLDLDRLTLAGTGPWIVGRQAAACSVVVPLDTVSRTHCEIRRTGDRFTVRNLSTNGTSKNGEPVPDDAFTELEDGDVVALQDVAFRFLLRRDGAGGAPPPPADRFQDASTLATKNPLEADLEAAVQRELAACIGCHECMRACPLEDAPRVTIGALNAYARDAGAADETVLRFVADCTQCHRCVPVCPADIRRSRLVLWNKLRTVPRDDQRLTLQVGEAQVASGLTVGHVAKELARHELFGTLGEADVRRLVAGARLRQLEPDEVLFREGEFLDALWLVWEGSLASEVWVAPTTGVVSAGGQGRNRSVVPYAPGQTVGEAALLADLPADATVRGRTRALVLGFTKYALTSLREREGNGGFDAALEGLYLGRSRGALLTRLGLEDETASAFAAELRPHRHAPGQTILSRVEAKDTLGWVSRGYVREVRRGLAQKRVANYVRAGDVFGGPDLETPDDVLIAYEAATQTDTFLLTRRQLGTLDKRFPGLAARLLPETGLSRGALDRRAGEDGTFACPGGLGPLQAHQLLVIDTRLCVDCNNCVDACERRHGRPRLERENAGLQQGPFQVPASCYHCVDPLCLFCSVNGIVRDPSGEIRIVEANCIGCGQCAERCPYDNIFMAPREIERPGLLQRFVAQPLKRLFGARGERWALDEEAQVAVKCDLCAGYDDGPACVRSCPTGAARRDDPAVLFGVGRGGANG
jgi:pSer/pThr/pTyr-binding forkhead associated (FHA) protein/Fe-S-cluster-containing hydrogenase component 2/CRP-like cAMP-binding protein